jgi:hypothetical protein
MSSEHSVMMAQDEVAGIRLQLWVARGGDEMTDGIEAETKPDLLAGSPHGGNSSNWRGFSVQAKRPDRQRH